MHFIEKKKPTGNIYKNRFHGRVIDVKASTTMLGPKCSQLLGLHGVSGCDTNGYIFRKGNLNALRLLRKKVHSFTHCLEKKQAHNLRWFRLGYNSFIIFMEKRDILEHLTKIYQRCKSKMPPIKALPPISPNFALHNMKRAHLRVMMWSSSYCSCRHQQVWVGGVG